MCPGLLPRNRGEGRLSGLCSLQGSGDKRQVSGLFQAFGSSGGLVSFSLLHVFSPLEKLLSHTWCFPSLTWSSRPVLYFAVISVLGFILCLLEQNHPPDGCSPCEAAELSFAACHSFFSVFCSLSCCHLPIFHPCHFDSFCHKSLCPEKAGPVSSPQSCKNIASLALAPLCSVVLQLSQDPRAPARSICSSSGQGVLSQTSLSSTSTSCCPLQLLLCQGSLLPLLLSPCVRAAHRLGWWPSVGAVPKHSCMNCLWDSHSTSEKVLDAFKGGVWCLLCLLGPCSEPVFE